MENIEAQVNVNRNQDSVVREKSIRKMKQKKKGAY